MSAPSGSSIIDVRGPVRKGRVHDLAGRRPELVHEFRGGVDRMWRSPIRRVAERDPATPRRRSPRGACRPGLSHPEAAGSALLRRGSVPRTSPHDDARGRRCRLCQVTLPGRLPGLEAAALPAAGACHLASAVNVLLDDVSKRGRNLSGGARQGRSTGDGEHRIPRPSCGRQRDRAHRTRGCAESPVYSPAAKSAAGESRFASLVGAGLRSPRSSAPSPPAPLCR